MPKRELGLQNFSITSCHPLVHLYLLFSFLIFRNNKPFLIIFQIENLKLKNRQHFKTSYILL